MFDHLRQKSAEESGVPTSAPKPTSKPKPTRASTVSSPDAALGSQAVRPKKKVVRRKKKTGLLNFFSPLQRFLIALFLFVSVSTMGCVLLVALQRIRLP